MIRYDYNNLPRRSNGNIVIATVSWSLSLEEAIFFDEQREFNWQYSSPGKRGLFVLYWIFLDFCNISIFRKFNGQCLIRVFLMSHFIRNHTYIIPHYNLSQNRSVITYLLWNKNVNEWSYIFYETYFVTRFYNQTLTPSNLAVFGNTLRVD